MTITSKDWTLIALVSTALLLALAVFGGGYRSLGALLLPPGLWFSLRHEPQQKAIRPGIRLLGGIFVGVAVVAILLASIAILIGR